MDGQARLAVYDLSGRLVETLSDGLIRAGTHSVVWDAKAQPSGVYVVRLESAQISQEVKALLVK